MKQKRPIDDWNGVKIPPGTSRDVELIVGESHSGITFKIPVHVRRGQNEGPVVFITAALHGDEINGAGSHSLADSGREPSIEGRLGDNGSRAQRAGIRPAFALPARRPRFESRVSGFARRQPGQPVRAGDIRRNRFAFRLRHRPAYGRPSPNQLSISPRRPHESRSAAVGSGVRVGTDHRRQRPNGVVPPCRLCRRLPDDRSGRRRSVESRTDHCRVRDSRHSQCAD